MRWSPTLTGSASTCPRVHAVVLSHGHFDHAAAWPDSPGRRGPGLPMVVHPLVWTRRRVALPGGGADDWPTLQPTCADRRGLRRDRAPPAVAARRRLVLITGEVDRTTDFEHGMPPHTRHWTGTTWEPDPLILDDQALVVNVRGRGLVVADRLRARRRRQHRPPRTAADRRRPGCMHCSAACTWAAPSSNPSIGPDGPRAHRTGTRPTGTRTLHRLASTAHPRRRATRQLGPRQQRHPLPARR